MDVKHYFIREAIKAGTIELKWIPCQLPIKQLIYCDRREARRLSEGCV